MAFMIYDTKSENELKIIVYFQIENCQNKNLKEIPPDEDH